MTIKTTLDASLRQRVGALTVGAFINTYRVCEGLTLSVMAKRLGLSTQQVSDLEKGRRFVSLAKALQLAPVLEASPQEMVTVWVQEQLLREGLPFKVALVS